MSDPQGTTPPPNELAVERFLTWQDIGLIAAVALLILLPGLDNRFIDRDEGWYAEVSREMVRSGDWLIPEYLGEPWLHKPPLTYWLVSASFTLFGLGEWQARLIPLLATIANAVLVGRLAAHMFGRGVGRLAGLIFITFGLTAVTGKMLLTDAVMLTCTLVAIDAHWRMAREAVTWERITIYGIAIGLGMLAKGPATLLFAGAFALGLLRWERTRAWIANVRWWAFLPIALAVALPWFIAVAQQEWDELVRNFFGYEIADRIQNPEHRHAAPPGYYFLISLGGLLPWTLFIPVTLVESWKHAREDRTVSIVLIWLAVPWILLELISSKLPHYILPCYVPLAILLARITYLALVPERKWIEIPKWERRGLVAWPIVMMVVGLGFAVAMLVLSRAPWAWAGAAAGISLIAGFAWVLKQLRTQPLTHAWAGGILVTLIFHFIVGAVMFRFLEPHRFSVQLGQTLRQTADYSHDIVLCGYKEPTTFFYLDRSAEVVHRDNLAQRLNKAERPVVLAITDEEFEQLDEPTRALISPILREERLDGFNYVKMEEVGVRYGLFEPRPR